MDSRLPQGTTPLVFAVGDVHGRLDLLLPLVEFGERDAARLGRPAVFVFLGDYVDRGPFSKGVVDFLMAGPRRPDDRWICLRGNHEELMLDGLSGSPRDWLRNGGHETLESYGHEVPSAHVDWMASLPFSHEDEARIFVHAGLKPGVPLPDQRPEDLTWIRREFLESDHDFGKLVVHGHTPARDYQSEPNRVGIDTGAYSTGRLTMAVFEEPTRDFRIVQAVRRQFESEVSVEERRDVVPALSI